MFSNLKNHDSHMVKRFLGVFFLLFVFRKMDSHFNVQSLKLKKCLRLFFEMGERRREGKEKR